MDPDIDEFNEDFDIPDDLDGWPFLRHRETMGKKDMLKMF